MCFGWTAAGNAVGNAAGDAAAGSATRSAGNRSATSVPWPGTDEIVAVPRCRRVIPYTSASPNPDAVIPLVVKNGSKARSRTSALIPTPVSRIAMQASAPSSKVRTVNVPPAGMASTAFCTRFRNASRSSPGNPRVRTRGANCRTIRTSQGSLDRGRRIDSVRSSTSSSSTSSASTDRSSGSSPPACTGSCRMKRPTRAAVTAPVSAASRMRSA